HTRKISIPDCVEFPITTNACRGFCESWSVPSAIETLRYNANQAITSAKLKEAVLHGLDWDRFGRITCFVGDYEFLLIGIDFLFFQYQKVEVRVMCLDGTRDLIFKSAKSCSCYHCKKD
ncbi:hypothetical protein J437_LFUL000825, partial [Ladona fulva]